MDKEVQFRVNQFKKFYDLLMKNAPDGYIPWFFPCVKNGKDPDIDEIKRINPQSHGSWHHKNARLTKEQCVQRIKDGGNIGISAREGDPLIIIDIDEEKYLEQIPKNTLTVTSRKRAGFHSFCWDKDGSGKLNIGTSYGEVRSNNQYVLSCGSYTPFNMQDTKEEVKYKKLPEWAKKDKELGYYTIKEELPPRLITFQEFPRFFIEYFEEGLLSDEKILEKQDSKFYEKKEGKYTELFNLKMSDIVGKIPSNKRSGHPLHDSDTDANFSLGKEGDVCHCWRHMVSLNPVQFLCVKAGYVSCEDAGTPHKSKDPNHKGRRLSKLKGDAKAYEVAYKESIKLGLIKKYSKSEESEDFKDFEYYSDADLNNYKPEPDSWLIENQIPKGDIGLLVGKRGHRKTWIALLQAYGLASGKDVFNDKVIAKKKVLFIDEESGKKTISPRRNLVKNGMEINEDVEVRFLSHTGLKLDINNSKFKKFEEVMDEFKPDLIIVDCLQRVVTFEVDKDNALISDLFTGVIRNFQKKYSSSWLFVHHLRKSPTGNYRPEDPLDEVRGGSELVNFSRYVLLCQEPKHQSKTEDGSQLLVFRALKMSNAEMPEPKVLKFTNVEDKLIVTYEGIPEEVLARDVRVANAIKEWLFNEQISGEFRTKDVNDASEKIGFERSLLSDGLRCLVKNGFLKKPKRGVYIVSGDVEKPKQKTLEASK